MPASPPPSPLNVDDRHVALQGYDPVSYFDGPAPLKGSSEIAATHEGAVYYFVSTANRDRFTGDPPKFLPEYGGYCATGVAHGYKVSCNPANYKIENGKLYLFNKTLFLNAADGWNTQQKQTADKNWERATGR